MSDVTTTVHFKLKYGVTGHSVVTLTTRYARINLVPKAISSFKMAGGREDKEVKANRRLQHVVYECVVC